MVISGGSAGGYTALAALVFHDAFCGGASYYGVSDIATLARDTHKFESHYLDWLIGPYPQEEGLYRERSPLFRSSVMGGSLRRAAKENPKQVAHLGSQLLPHSPGFFGWAALTAGVWIAQARPGEAHLNDAAVRFNGSICAAFLNQPACLTGHPAPAGSLRDAHFADQASGEYTMIIAGAVSCARTTVKSGIMCDCGAGSSFYAQ
jgi:hypothetical protein